jgi:succinate dehydrogenase hydrophobic anchor subunit
VQALLGFQLTVTLTQAFAELTPAAKMAHTAALCCIALAVVLLMAPASVHRIAFAGEDDPEFLTIGSIFVVAAPLPLALGIALDSYVAGRALESDTAALSLATTTAVVLLGFWYVFPIWRRVGA